MIEPVNIKNKYIDQSNIDAINQCKFGTFDQLLQNEFLIREITQFCWLWPFFENCRLGTKARYKTIAAFCTPRKNSQLSADELNAHRYFSLRYAPDGKTNDKFGVLLAGGTRPDMKTALENGIVASAEPKAKRLALVCIVYRLRNNLFHGNKADRDMSDQFKNFQHANALLRNWLCQG